MSETDIEYRGHLIDVQSAECDGPRWRPKAVVSMFHSGVLDKTVVSAPVEVMFGSEVEADTCALAMAKKWIDDHQP